MLQKTISSRAFWKYYRDLLPFNLGASLVVALWAGPLWGLAVFGTLGNLIGKWSFDYFWKEQYYFYHNLGMTKGVLLKGVVLINVTGGLLLAILAIAAALLFS